MDSTNDILLKIIEKASELYPNSVSKTKALVNAKSLYKRVLSAFTPTCTQLRCAGAATRP